MSDEQQIETEPRAVPRTLSEQRRLAQQASVRARRHKKALRAQVEAEPREQVRKGMMFLNTHLPPDDDVFVNLASLDLARRELHYWAYLLSPANPVYINDAALRIVRALHNGQGPVWVRKWRETFTHSSPALIVPPRSWWWTDGGLTLALRIVDVKRNEEPVPPYVYTVVAFDLRLYDLLEHHDRRAGSDMAAEAFAWQPILEGDLSPPGLESRPADPQYANMKLSVVHIPGPVPSRLHLARGLVEEWIKHRWRRLPWAEE